MTDQRSVYPFADYPVDGGAVAWDAETGKWASFLDAKVGTRMCVGLFETAGEAQWAHDVALLDTDNFINGSLDLAAHRERYLNMPPPDPDDFFYKLVWRVGRL